MKKFLTWLEKDTSQYAVAGFGWGMILAVTIMLLEILRAYIITGKIYTL